MLRIEISAPAKVNLGLRIVGSRADGYHLLESVFVPIDLADELTLTVEPGSPGPAGPHLELEVHADSLGRADLPTDDRNLALRAARDYLAALAALRTPAAAVRVQLLKRIPSAAGLGGGSSDAAAVLLGLRELLGEPAPDLPRLALSLGADVPFFLDPRPSLVRGIGEELSPIDGLPALDLLLVNPGVSLSTVAVFRHFDALEAAPRALTPGGPGPTLPPLADRAALKPEDLSRLLARANDLERAAVSLCPEVAELRDRLHALDAIGVGMSGSGATVWAAFESERRARAAEAVLERDLPEGSWTRTVRSAASRAGRDEMKEGRPETD